MSLVDFGILSSFEPIDRVRNFHILLENLVLTFLMIVG